MTYSEWLQIRGCEGKLSWATKREARRAATDSASHYGEPRDTWRAYRCDHCCLWHCGHTDTYRDHLNGAAA